MRFSPPQQLFGFVALIRFPANATETTSVWRGVYTNEQAALGKARYFAACGRLPWRLAPGDK
jgi:hypothetical protein